MVDQTTELADVIERRVVATTPSLLPLVKQICLAAAHDITVTLTGETGTGKTFFARLIHDCSSRKDEPFMVVPCGALAASLIESELFGHARGAFTGADRTKIGRLEAAGRGTLLLDEIDTLGLEQQVSLLRVVETGEYEPVGSNTTQTCEARLIVASNWDLEKAVAEGRFRQDLWYRLNVLSIHLAPLRERILDIAPLARQMAAHFCKKFGKDSVDISAEALAALEAFPWPGNVRQVDNVIQNAILMCNGPTLLRKHLPPPFEKKMYADSAGPEPGHVSTTSLASLAGNGNTPEAAGSLEKGLAQKEQTLIQKTLEANRYNCSRAAAALGISRVTLYKKMKKYGILRNRWLTETP